MLRERGAFDRLIACRYAVRCHVSAASSCYRYNISRAISSRAMCTSSNTQSLNHKCRVLRYTAPEHKAPAMPVHCIDAVMQHRSLWSNTN
eukprot:11217-Heterococcus_DN1.PRE.2